MAARRVLKLADVHARDNRGKHLVRAYLSQLEIIGTLEMIHLLKEVAKPTLKRVLNSEQKALVAEELRYRESMLALHKQRRQTQLNQSHRHDEPR